MTASQSIVPLIEVVDFACGIAQLTKGENLPRIADGLDGETMREPIGVCAGITPFNFPAMVPMWMFPLAIACGNTFVLKPSEKVPLTANRLAQLFLEAGLPAGIFNVIHGGREVVDALCSHPLIAAISFVGSTRIARHVYERGCQSGKRVQADRRQFDRYMSPSSYELDAVRAIQAQSECDTLIGTQR